MQRILCHISATSMTSPVVMDDLKLPWMSNADMLSVLEDDDKRKKLVQHMAKVPLKPGKAASDFIQHLYHPKMKKHIHTIE